MKKYLILVALLSTNVLLFAQNNSFCFDGNDAFLFPATPAKLNNLNSYTFETWYFRDGGSTSPRQTIYLRDQGTNKTALTTGYSVTATGGTATATSGVFYFRANLSTPILASSTSTLSTAITLVHIAVTYDGANLRFYINGNLTNTLATATASLMANTTATNNACFGHYNNTNWLQGKLDNFRVWNYARTQSQIQQYYRCNMLGNETGLLANYLFNETSGTILNDNVSPFLNGSYGGGGPTALCTGWFLSPATNLTPTIAITPFTNGVCLGNSITLNASGAATYSWSTGANSNTVSVSPTVTTSYTVTGTNATNACYNQSVKSLSINPSPNIGLSTGSNPICYGNLTWITATSPATTYSANTYTMLPGGIIQNGPTAGWNITPTVSTTYTISGTSALGCISTKTINIGVVACTGITEVNNLSLYSIYPNPTSGIINIVSKEEGEYFISVYNILGEEIHSQSFRSKCEIDLSGNARGQYYFLLRNNEGKTSSGKFAIQ